MCFAMVPCPERKEIRELIQSGGGVLLQPGKDPDAVHLAPACITTTQGPEDLFSANYVRACCSNNKLFPLKDFKIPIAPAVVTLDDECDAKKRQLRSVRSRREYTLGEQIAIAKYVAKAPKVHVRGNQLYKEMAAASVVPGAHSWQSLKEHYLKKILPWKHLYESPDASTALSKKRQTHAAQDEPRVSPGTASGYGSVIVEDSSSDDDEQLQERRRDVTEVGGVEEDKWDTETEVVQETDSQGGTSPSQGCDTPNAREPCPESRKRKKLLLSQSLFFSSQEKSSGEGSTGLKTDISVQGVKSCDASNQGGIDHEKSATPPRAKSKLSSSKDVRFKMQFQPGKRVDTAGREGAQTTSPLLESILNPKQLPQSWPLRKLRNAKQPETPADHSIDEQCGNVHNMPHSHPFKGLEVLDSAGERQTTQSLPKSNAGTAGALKHSKSTPSSSLHSPNRHSTPVGDLEEQASSPTKRRSLRLPARKKPSTKSQPDKQNDAIGRGSTENISVPESVLNQKQPLLSSPKKPRNAKRRERPPGHHSSDKEYQSASVQDISHSDQDEGLSVLKSSSKQQATRPLPQKKIDNAASPKHSHGSPKPLSHSQRRDCATVEVLEEQVYHPSKPRSFQSPMREKQSTVSQANPASRLNVRLASESSDNGEAATNRSQYTLASSRWKLLKVSPRKQRSATRQQSNLDGHLEELADSESTDGVVVATKTSHSSPESVYHTVESDGTSPTSKPARRDRRSLRLQQKRQQGSNATATETSKRTSPPSALRRSDSTSPDSKDQCPRRIHQTASCEKEQMLVQGTGSVTSGFDSADESLLVRIAKQASALGVSAADRFDDEQDDASTVTMSSDSERWDEVSTPELTPESHTIAEVHRELSRLLDAMTEGRSMPPHTTCPPNCTCPLTNWYTQAARAAVSLGAFMAFHDRPLPQHQVGTTDPVAMMTLELVLRHFEHGTDEGNGSVSQ